MAEWVGSMVVEALAAEDSMAGEALVGSMVAVEAVVAGTAEAGSVVTLTVMKD